MIAASLIMGTMLRAAHVTEWWCQNYSNQSEINCPPKWVGLDWHQNTVMTYDVYLTCITHVKFY